MRSLSSLGLGLSLVFGCLLLALLAELYYLLWWKKRITSREIEDDYSSPAREFLYMFCWKKSTSLSSEALNPQETQVRIHSNKDLWLKPCEEDDVDTELMRLQNLQGPPRFLFTINEETKEDLESEEVKSRKGSRSKSLTDIVLTVETPFLTPIASPPYFTPPLTPTMDSSYNQKVFNSLFESSTDAEFNRIRSSPPPKFNFLRDAEEKLYRRNLMKEAEKGLQKNQEYALDNGAETPSDSMFLKDDNGSFITLVIA